jgi:hypothetical protein
MRKLFCPILLDGTPRHWEQTYLRDGEVVLSAAADLPQTQGAPSGSGFGDYYGHLLAAFQRRCAQQAQLAAQACQEARSAARWFAPWRSQLTFTAEADEDRLTISWRLEENPGATVTGQECWSRSTGVLLD